MLKAAVCYNLKKLLKYSFKEGWANAQLKAKVAKKALLKLILALRHFLAEYSTSFIPPTFSYLYAPQRLLVAEKRGRSFWR